jgi:hypothetical protein
MPRARPLAIAASAGIAQRSPTIRVWTTALMLPSLTSSLRRSG